MESALPKIKSIITQISRQSRLFWQNFSFAKAVIILALTLGTFHVFCYLFPFTDNAFVVTNVSPVAADVSGFITKIYIKNGQNVKAGQAIFKVYQPPYALAYQKSKADFLAAKQKIRVLKQQIQKTKARFHSIEAGLNKINFELKLKKSQAVAEAVAKLEIVKLAYDAQIYRHQKNALSNEIKVLKESIKEQKLIVQSLKAKHKLDKINLDLTIVRAPKDGVIDNMYVAENTPIRIHQPVFSFIDTSNYYIQANFNETDLRNVRPGDKVYILLRMYYFNKLFRGEVVNTLWAAERQATSSRSQIQKVQNENEWLLLPQRFPIQIKILNPDPKYPLHPGASAYVYISTR